MWSCLVGRSTRNNQRTLEVPTEQVTAWCDSTIVLCWLRNSPVKYKTSIANRISTATSCLPPSAWFHVPTDENPADCASRGLSARELREHELWWSGPPWLLQEPIAVPRQPQNSDLDALKDQGAKPSTCMVVSTAPAVWLEARYSSYRTHTCHCLGAKSSLQFSISHSPTTNQQGQGFDSGRNKGS